MIPWGSLGVNDTLKAKYANLRDTGAGASAPKPKPKKKSTPKKK